MQDSYCIMKHTSTCTSTCTDNCTCICAWTYTCTCVCASTCACKRLPCTEGKKLPCTEGRPLRGRPSVANSRLSCNQNTYDNNNNNHHFPQGPLRFSPTWASTRRGVLPPPCGGKLLSKELPVLPIPSSPAQCREDSTYAWSSDDRCNHVRVNGGSDGKTRA